MSSETETGVVARFQRALDTLVAALKQDRTILAAILGGSLSHDTVWEKSDIDLILIGDESHKQHSITLVEEGVTIHAAILPRSAFRKVVDGSLQTTFFHSFLSKGRLLYTHDESLEGIVDDLQKVGARDREWQFMRVAAFIPPGLAKAEKWFHVRRDYRYAFTWLLGCVSELARIEIISHGLIPGREVIQQALPLNPAFFQKVYTDLIDGPKDEAAIGGALDAVTAYLDARTRQLFGPLLDFLEEAGGPRTVTEIDAHFHARLQSNVLEFACDWLAERGVIDKIGLPRRLSDKSRVTVNEAAYYYDGDFSHPPAPSLASERGGEV